MMSAFERRNAFASKCKKLEIRFANPLRGGHFPLRIQRIIKIPDELYEKAAELARQRHVSVDEIIAAAFSQQLAALDRLQERAGLGDRKRFLDVLDKAPDVEPEESDRL